MKPANQVVVELLSHDTNDLRADVVGEFLERLVTPLTESETVGVFQALGRVLAEDVVSPISVPPHDNSAMDGFALTSTALRPGTEVRLRVVGSAFAGTAWSGTTGPLECVKIMTGAVMPAGLDTVVPIEQVQLDGEHIVLPVDLKLRAGDNRRLRGEDVMAGQPALRSAAVAVFVGILALALAMGVTAMVIGLIVATLAGFLMAWLCLRQIGGQTGDVLGALEQVIETLILLTAVATCRMTS